MNIFDSIHSVNIYVFIIAILIILKPIRKVLLLAWHTCNDGILKKYNQSLDNLNYLEKSYKDIKEKNESFDDYEISKLIKSNHNTQKFINYELEKTKNNLEYKYNIFISDLSTGYLQKIRKIIENINNDILNEVSSINDQEKTHSIGINSLKV